MSSRRVSSDATARAYTVTATGLKGLKVVGVDGPLALAAESSQMVPLSVQAPADDDEPATSAGDGAQRKRSHRIEIVVEAVGDPKVVRREETSFLFPR